MDDLEKSLRSLTTKERKLVKDILLRLVMEDFHGLDMRKLKGAKDIFRVRKGPLRIIYRKEGIKVFVLAIERRKEDTYKGI